MLNLNLYRYTFISYWYTCRL